MGAAVVRHREHPEPGQRDQGMKLPLWRRRQDEELDEEIRGHLQMAVDDRVERGQTPADAAAAARREFGSVALAKETTREAWGWFWMDQLAQDVVYACRTLRKAPGFTAVAVLTLALGIGANTAMFSVIQAVLFRPLPFPDPNRIVAIGEVDFRRAGRGATSVSWPNYFDWRARAHTFTGLSAYRDAAFTLVGAGPSQHIPGAVVSADFFSTLGVQPVLGRAFRQDEERAGSDVVVASDAFWRTQLGGAAKAVGRTLALNGRSFALVGILPPGFRFPIAFPPPQLWTTAAEDARVENPTDSPMTAERGAHFLRVVGRLRAGVELAAAQADLDVVARALAQ